MVGYCEIQLGIECLARKKKKYSAISVLYYKNEYAVHRFSHFVHGSLLDILSYACHMGPNTLELGRACLLGLGEGGATSLGHPSGSPAASAVVVSGTLLTIPPP